MLFFFPLHLILISEFACESRFLVCPSSVSVNTLSIRKSDTTFIAPRNFFFFSTLATSVSSMEGSLVCFKAGSGTRKSSQSVVLTTFSKRERRRRYLKLEWALQNVDFANIRWSAFYTHFPRIKGSGAPRVLETFCGFTILNSVKE